MRIGKFLLPASLLLAVTAASSSTHAQLLPAIPNSATQIQLIPLMSGLGSPLDLMPAGDNTSRLFEMEQTGRIHILTPGNPTPQVFLDLSSRLTSLNSNYDERGLLGLAFSPGFANPQSPGYRKFYTYTTEPTNSGTPDFPVPPFGAGSPSHHNVIAEWTVSANNPNLADPASRRELLRIAHPQSNHDGGTIAFGPDGYLYITSGDGGSANDTGYGHTTPGGNGQATNTVLGKILRIDPQGNNSANGKYGIPADNPFDGVNGAKEIFAHGFRNPYRMAFDNRPGGNGDLYVGDVGQRNIEEIDRVIKGGNYGWNVKEGTFLFNSVTGGVGANSPGAPAGLIDPIGQYDHSNGNAIVGGFIYRGAAMPALVGKFIFGDFTGSLRSGAVDSLFALDVATGQIERLLINPALPTNLSLKGFGQDANGELYVLASTNVGPAGTGGVIYQIVPEPASAALLLFTLGSTLLLRPHQQVQSSQR